MSALPLFVILVLSPTSRGFEGPVAEDNPAWKERFYEEAPLAWKKYAIRAKSLNVTYTYKTFETKPENRLWFDMHFEIKHRPDCALLLNQRSVFGFKPDRTGTLSAFNPRYAFALERLDSSRPWTISKIEMNDEKMPTIRPESKTWGSDILLAPVAFTLLPYDFGIFGEQPGFTANSIGAVIQDGRTLVKVDFVFQPQDPDLKTPWAEGWAIYDPARSWVMRKRRVLAKHPNPKSNYHNKGVLSEVDIEYNELDHSFPILKVIKNKFSPYDQYFDSNAEINLSVTEVDVPEREFTLSAYGFPEPK